jgi:DNA-binding NarL/FixJ family response regulator
VILIVDDHPLVGQALRAVVGSAFNHTDIRVVSTLGEAEDVIRSAKPGVRLVLLDLMLPDTKGFDALLRVKQHLANTPVAIMSARADSHTVAMASALGASGFLDKTAPVESFVDAAAALMRGETVFPAQPPEPPDASSDTARRLRSLTRAQLRILSALTDGASNREIAAEMNLSEGTVKQHVSAILRRLNVQNRSQAILAARTYLRPGE